MEIKVYSFGGIKVVALRGKLDHSGADVFRNRLLDVIAPGSKMILDMRECLFISSAGLRSLLIIAKNMKRMNGQAVLCGLSMEIREMIRMTGFEDLFKIFPGLHEAEAFLR